MPFAESPDTSRPAYGLFLEPCNRATAGEACRRWHYLGKIGAVTVAQFAVYEDGEFIGTVVFGAGPRLLSGRYRCKPREACELTRVALGRHRTPTSRIVAIAIRLLQQRRPDLRLIVSFADSDQGHHGGIYQAGGWIFTGSRKFHSALRVKGKVVHPRSLSDRYGTSSVEWLRKNIDPRAKKIETGEKHRYLMPLDEPMRRRVQALALAYPKRPIRV